ncbi:hypothetical protein [Cytobacillus sp. FSL R5-0596]|uniref:hypothetical protein n=1 Tax=Cytobacillus sp. FSL R5-0596 TaxID=2954696 RepID=UPI0030FA26EF
MSGKLQDANPDELNHFTKRTSRKKFLLDLPSISFFSLGFRHYFLINYPALAVLGIIPPDYHSPPALAVLGVIPLD